MPGTTPTRTDRRPAHHDPEAALMRLRLAVERETGPLYELKDTGRTDVLPVLSRLAFLLLELGFTVAEEGGIDCTEVENAVSAAYDLPHTR